MKFIHIFLFSSFVIFYYLFNEFLDLGGMNFRLLKVLMELILLLFILILIKYKKDLNEMTNFDKYQITLDNFFHKKNK